MVDAKEKKSDSTRSLPLKVLQDVGNPVKEGYLLLLPSSINTFCENYILYGILLIFISLCLAS